MEQPTPIATVTSELGVGQTPSNERFHDLQQEYLDQWHVLANLESDLPSETHSEEQQESSAFFQNSTANVNIQGVEPSNDHQEKESSEQWFILDEEESSEVVGPEVRFDDEEANVPSTSKPDKNIKQNEDNIIQLSPYAEQWYELEQLKANVRSLSHAAGIPQSPQTSPLPADETLASGLSSGLLSVENLDEVGLQDIEALPQEVMTNQDERAFEDHLGESGTSFSMDGSGTDLKRSTSEWFPLRPNAVGEDDEDASHVTTAGTVTVAHGSNSSDRLQNIPHAWSDDDSKHSPPERSQPDGRDGPDLKRTPWMANNPPVAAPSSQSSDIDNGTAASKDSASDVSVMSQPQSDHNSTPLDIITRSVPPTKKGVSLMSELRQRRAPQLNSDSDTESPVSKLLGPNFRAVQQVLDKLKQEKLSGSVSDEAEEVASERQSSTEESLRSVSSAGLPATTSLSRDHEAQWTSQTKPRSSIEPLNSRDAPSSRAFFAHNEEPTGERYSLDESHRRFSDSNIAVLNAKEGSDTRRISSWSSARVSYDPGEMSPAVAVPRSTMESAAKKSSHDLLQFSSEANSVTNVRMLPSTQLTVKYPSLELLRFSSAATSATNVRMLASTQLAVRESSQDLMRFSSAASSATNVRKPASAQLTVKKSSHDLMQFSSAGSSATNVRIPASTQFAVKKTSQDLMQFSSTASSVTNGRIIEEYPLASTDDHEDVSYNNLIDAGPADGLPPPLLPTTNKYSPEQSSRSSIERSLKSSRIAWGEHATPALTTAEMTGRKSYEALQSGGHASVERLHDLTPRSSIESNIPTSTTEIGIPASSLRELSGHSPKQADNVAVSGGTSLTLGDRTRASSQFPNITEQDESKTPQNVDSLQHLRDSDATASSDDTDDLLSYEPVLEGDRQYLRMQIQSKRSEHRQKPSEALENSDSRILAGRSREINTAARLSGKDESPFTLQSQEGVLGNPLRMDDSHIKSLHWSLGAGTISPISVTGLAQLSSQKEKSSTPLGPISERSSVLENGTLQEQSIEEDDTSAQTEDRDLTASKQIRSRSTTELSSSDEMYRPVLYRDGLDSQENRTSSYGIYDIRRSSGPGSTNRRRKALGLEPNPARENASQNRGSMVYISGDSTPSSVRDGSRQPSREEVDLAGSAAAYRETQPGLKYYEGRMGRDEGLRRPRTQDYGMVRELNAREVPRTNDFRRRDVVYLSREERRSDRSHRHQSRAVASQDASVRNSTLEQSRNITERSRQLAGQYMESTEPKGTASRDRRSGSSRKSRSKYPGDDLASSSLQTPSEQASRSRKHRDSKTRNRSRDGKDSHARLDANISKLSSLISKSTDESISSSSQTSVIPVSRWPSKRSKRHKTSSSSGSSDVSEYFNYAFMEPYLRSSIKHKIRLRELLKSVKSRDISPIVRFRDDTSTESASFVSSDGTAGRDREEKTPEEERGASPEVTHPPRPQAFEIPVSTSRPTESESQVPCTCLRRPAVAQTATPYDFRKREKRNNGVDIGMPQKRDVGVNIPTPVVSRSQSPSSDYSRQHEDASTQTEELEIRRGGKREVERKPVKSQRRSVKSPLRDAEECGVISQLSPSKSDFIYRVEQRESKHQPKDRLIASQNSPSHCTQNSSERTRKAPVPTWFLPLTSKTQTEKITETHFKTPSRSRTSDEFRVDVFDSAVNPSPSLQKLSLQEAFLYARPQFVKRSQERVARIEQAAREKERRKIISEAVAEEHKIAQAQKAKPTESVVAPTLKPRVKTAGQLHVPKPRQMTRAEMKELNKRLYKNLPEVKAKNEQVKRQAFYRTNRLRAQLYGKRVRNRLKSAGN